MSRSPLLALISTSLALLGPAVLVVAQAQETYKTRLSPVAATNQTRAEVSGIGSASAVLAGSKLTITGTFEGLRTPATVARLHNGVALGARGPAIRDLTVTKAASGSVSGSLDLTAPEIDSLRKGKLYIQIHSEKPPDGTLWGWLTR
jgi:glucose/arabinose dehydrogenase